VSQCHCGTTREDALRQAEAASGTPLPRPARLGRPGPPVRWGTLGRDVQALLIAIVVVALLGLVRLFWPSRPEPLLPVLGHMDATPSPTPRPTARPTPKPKSKGFRLPWQ
jgi:hypothetical protein